jgi:hypothetical protein
MLRFLNPRLAPLRRTVGARLGWLATALLAAALLGGCSSAPGVIFDPADGVHQWPPPPDPAHIRYVGQLRTDQDLKPGRSGIQRLGEAIFGGNPPQEMISPLAVCTDGGQRVFIADSNDQIVHMFDLATRKYERWGPPPEQKPFVTPVALVYDPGSAGTPGRLLVSDSAAGRIVVFDATGRYTGSIGEGLLNRPCGLAVDPVGLRIFVADAGAHQIVVLGMNGKESGRLGVRGSGPGEFNYPTNVAVDRAGRLYVSDSLNFRVQVFSPNLEFIRQIGRKGDLPGYFSQPKGLAIDPDNNLYVVDANFEAVQLFNAEGALLMSFGREGHGPGEFWLPAGIFIDGAGRIFVTDSYNRRVQVFDYLSEGRERTKP